ncbi:MAG TPA: T9SS type A sorting domain-containing protein, partial [Bacteroidota bacterium]|nr:T9SS type A sorting domain-containing protein [Bacteroidota bacterium]
YGVIDPANKISELKKDNNKAWNRIAILGTITGVKDFGAMASSFKLFQNYPNPFNPSTTIQFDLKENSLVKLDIFDILGQEVKQFDLGRMIVGSYSRNIDLSQFASGVYFYRIEATSLSNPSKTFTQVKKMVLMR